MKQLQTMKHNINKHQTAAQIEHITLSITNANKQCTHCCSWSDKFRNIYWNI